VREILKQPPFSPIGVFRQIAALLAVTGGALDDTPVEEVSRAEREIQARIHTHVPRLVSLIESGERLGVDDYRELLEASVKVIRGSAGKSHADR
jgi:F-type H+-transporting ATPase subunit alpha